MNAHTVPIELIQEAAAFIRERIQYQPHIGIILGSGLSSLADELQNADVIPYGSIPHFVPSTVQGHSGRLVIGQFEGHEVLVMQGRVHFYEGYSMQQVTFPIRVIKHLGIHTLIITNAAGGLDPHWTPGELMLIADHINLVGMTGLNPLVGPNNSALGPRFPDMSQAYDPALRKLALQIARAKDIPLREGVYVCLGGPSFETPAEIRFLRIIGADAVGMSTAPEVTVARHMGMRVLGISGITNVHAAEATRPRETSHQEVLETSQIITPRMVALIRNLLKQL
jgi:purine-nucleoside phosphorylase